MKNRHYAWAVIELANKKRVLYQLSKDLQFAIRMEQQFSNRTTNEILEDFTDLLINVPISRFKKNNQTQIDTGRILKAFMVPMKTSVPKKITRGQIKKVQRNKLGFPKIKEIKNYMIHDYNKTSQKRIKKSINKLTYRLYLERKI